MRPTPSNTKGFTLVEVLVALIILSTGITAIFKSYFISLDRLQHINNRLYATSMLDSRLSEIERVLRAEEALPLNLSSTQEVDVGGRSISFDEEIRISEVEGFNDVFLLDLSITWNERGNMKKISRSSYISELDTALN